MGANVGVELAYAQHKVSCLNWSGPADNQDKFSNKRAECYWRLREWMLAGGEFVDTEITRKRMKDLTMIKYKRDNRGRIVIMPKDEMRKQYGKSPDGPDAFAMMFWEEERKVLQNSSKPVISKVTGQPMGGQKNNNQRPNFTPGKTTSLYNHNI